MSWDTTPAGVEYWTREVLRAELLGVGNVWETWQDAIDAALGDDKYTLPEAPDAASIWIDGPPPQDPSKDYPVISVDWVPPRIMGDQVDASDDWETSILVQVKWWFCHDGSSDGDAFETWEVGELVQDDLHQMILMALMAETGGIVQIGTPQVTAMKEMDSLAQSPRPISASMYALTGVVTFQMEQEAQCR